MKLRLRKYAVPILLFLIFIPPFVIGLAKDLSKSRTSHQHHLRSEIHPVDTWEYHWGTSQSRQIPDSGWLRTRSPVNPPGREGRDILWLRARLPSEDYKAPVLLIDGKGILLTFEVFLNGEMIYKFGTLTPDGEGNISGLSSHLIHLGDQAAGEIIYFRIFSDYSNIGIRGKTFIGSKADLILRVVEKETHWYLIGFFMILIGLIDLFTSRTKAALVSSISMFGILAISQGIYVLSLTSLKDILFPFPNFWFLLYICGITLIPVGMVGFIQQTFGLARNHLLKKLWYFHIIYAPVCLLSFVLALNAVIPISIGTFLLNLIRWFLLLEMFLTTAIAFKEALVPGNIKARIYCCGFLPAIIASIHDLLVGLGKLNSTVSFVPWGLVMFILSLEIIQRVTNIKMQNRLLVYTKKLEKTAKEKAELINDLHDGIGGLVTNIKFLSQMGLKSKTLENKNDSLSSISELSKESMIEIGHFMQSLENDIIEWNLILDTFRHIGDTMIKPLGINFTLHEAISERADMPDRILFINLLRIFREALTNITKHSKATSVSVILNVVADKILMEIKDNGVGFEAGANKGKGLKSMQTRARKLGGELLIASQDGTCVSLAI